MILQEWWIEDRIVTLRISPASAGFFHAKRETMMSYTTRGNVRGCCGHKHRTIEAASKCLLEDQSGCASQGGYSDRDIVRADGEDMTEAEYITLIELEY